MPDTPPDDYDRLLMEFHSTVEDLQKEIDRADEAQIIAQRFKRLATKNLNDKLRVAGELDQVRHEMTALRGAVHTGEHQLTLLKEEVYRLKELVQIMDKANITPTWEQ